MGVRVLHGATPELRANEKATNSESSPTHKKAGWGMCHHAYMISAYKRTCVDSQNMLNHHPLSTMSECEMSAVLCVPFQHLIINVTFSSFSFFAERRRRKTQERLRKRSL